jgi:hypothetical protein
MFGRHETFAPRAGWFKKVYDGITANPDVFRGDDATLTLGVGKNMVRSMRFWAGAAGLVVPRRVSRNETLRPSHFAGAFFPDDGLDPFLENPSTLWLLHWRLMGSGCHLPVWHFAFTDLQHSEFTVDMLAGEAEKASSTLYGFERQIAPTSVRRDAECLIHTYARRLTDRMLLDDSLACPFRLLGLMESAPGRAGAYRFAVGPKSTLHDDIILFAALDFAAVHARGNHSISIGRLTRSPMSPGRVFKLDEDSLLEALNRAARRSHHLTVVDTAGVSALQFSGDAEGLAVRALNAHFKSAHRRLLHLREESDILAGVTTKELNA